MQIENKHQNRYPILLVFDRFYSEYSIVLISSIINKTRHKKHIFFHIITDSQTDYSFQENYLISNEIGFSLYKINSEEISGFPTLGHITKGAYYLFYAMETINEINDSILYMDIDIYVNSDITEVFQYTNKAYALNCINSGPDNYFGGGFFLINQNKSKIQFNIDVVKKVFEHNPNLKWMDQDLLNIIFREDSIKNIPYVWDFPMQNYLLNKNYFHKKNIYLRDAKSVHYPGTAKPWRFSTILPFAREWRTIYFKIYKSSPWEKITIREYLLRFLYIIFFNPSFLFKLQRLYNKIKVYIK